MGAWGSPLNRNGRERDAISGPKGVVSRQEEVAVVGHLFTEEDFHGEPVDWVRSGHPWRGDVYRAVGREAVSSPAVASTRWDREPGMCRTTVR